MAVIKCRVTSKLNDILVADALVLKHTLDGVGKHVGNGELHHFCAAIMVGDGVGEHNFLKG